MTRCSICSIFSTIQLNYELLLKLHALTLAALSYVLLVLVYFFHVCYKVAKLQVARVKKDLKNLVAIIPRPSQ